MAGECKMEPGHHVGAILHRRDAVEALRLALRAVDARGLVQARELRVQVRLDRDITLELELGREGSLDLEQVSAWVDGVAVCGQRAAVQQDARQLQVLAVEEQRCIGGRPGSALDVQRRQNLSG